MKYTILSAVAVAILAGGLYAQDQFGNSSLHPPIPAPSPEAYGGVKLKRSGTVQKFSVKALRIPQLIPPGPFEVWLESAAGSGAYASVGAMEMSNTKVKDLRDWELNLTNDGAPPPELGVVNLDELAERRIQVREAGGGLTHLEGYAPALFDEGAVKTPVLRGPVYFQRTEPAPDPNAVGHFHTARKGVFQTLHANIFFANPGSGDSFGVFVETAVGSGSFAFVNGMTLVHKTTNHWRLHLGAQDAAPAALGVADVNDLAGRRLEIRDSEGKTYLWGMARLLQAKPYHGSFVKKAALVKPASPPAPAAKGVVTLRYNGGGGRDIFELNAKNLPVNSSYRCFVESAAGSGSFVNEGKLEFKIANPSNGTFKRDTKDGDPLPGNVAGVAALAGRKVEVRDVHGVVYLTATLP